MKSKGNEYVFLKSLYYDHKEDYEALYESRYNSSNCVHLNFIIGNNPAFFMETPELLKKVIEITRLNNDISKLVNNLPPIAVKQYINKCLIDEIVITNNIEGVHSTRKEIGEILDDLESKSKKRFFGLVNKYRALLTVNDLSIKSSEDVRALYDEMFLSEIISEDPNDEPDGEIFRKGSVNVLNPMLKTIHRGLYPESKIIDGMETAIGILNDDEIEPLFRISLFHYLIGYIHPFYNGNGRLSRFISSYYLSSTLESIMGYRLSYTIKENLSTYYKGFKIVNEKINKGDITPFIIMFLDFIRESAINLKDGLIEKDKRLKLFASYIGNLPNDNSKIMDDLYLILIQASLFSEIGISTSELLDHFTFSRPTLQKKLSFIENNNLLITEKRSKHKFYQLNLDTLVEMIKNV